MISNINIDLFWLNKLSYRLDQFSRMKSTSKIVFTCRCPVCGDSKTKKFKKRFFVYEKKGSINCNCKNCGYSRSFYNFVKEVFPEFFDDYKRSIMLDKLQSNKTYSELQAELEQRPKQSIERLIDGLIGCQRIQDLPSNHYCVSYLKSRAITEDMFDLFLFSENFKETAKHFSHKEISEKFPEEPRLVIPFYTQDKKIKAIQGRSFDKDSKVKYITLKSDENGDKIYGLERIDRSKTVYCIEGPIDSLFIDNCIATCDANLMGSDADVYIWDNQPRNKEVVKLMQQCIDLGSSLVIWPEMGDAKVDINDLIVKGMKRSEIMSLIKSRTFHGLRAKMEFVKWKKV